MRSLSGYTVRSLRANKVRTGVTIAGVALAAALLTAVFTTFSSLAHFLYQMEVHASGTWMASAQTQDLARFSDGLARAAKDPSVEHVAVLSTVGYGELTPEQQDMLGQSQPIVSVEGDAGELLGIRPSEGRFPEHEGEILLFEVWPEQGARVGDDLTFSVGTLQRPAEDDPSAEVQVVDGSARTYEVVGFFDRANLELSSDVGVSALTVGDADEASSAVAYLSFSGMGSAEGVEEAAEGLFPDARVKLHSSLLRYMGISSGASIWATFIGIVVVLASVIMLSCVSLIYNAFDISVAERIRQFGLLSSVGATRGQLRRVILLEAFLVALVGIPLGILVGLGGCWATFAWVGPLISDLAGGLGIPFEVAVDGRMLGVAAALTLVTVIISAWIPAKRASRTNIIDAIRATGTSRISKRGRAQAERATDPERIWRGAGIGARIFGVGGYLARASRKRTRSKGRAASVSLALAVVLLVTAGSLNVLLSLLTGAVMGGEPAGEVSVTAQAKEGGRPDGAPLAAQERMQMRNGELAEEERAFQGAFSALAGAPDAQPVGWYLAGSCPITMPKQMVGSALEEGGIYGVETASGEIATMARLSYVSDDAFDAYAESLGLDPERFREPGAVRAIGVAKGYGNDGTKYRLMQVLREVGTVSAVTAAVAGGTTPMTVNVAAEERTESGFVGYAVWGDDTVAMGESYPLEELDIATLPLEVAAIADEPPVLAGMHGEGVSLIVPMSLAQTTCLVEQDPVFRSYFDPVDGDHAALAQQLNDIGHVCFSSEEMPFELAFVSYNDHQAEMDSNQVLSMVVNVFCLLFAAILALIAMANVFNTVTNSLILRRREFAVLKSIGMSNGQFRRMIVDECAAFGVAGLIPGLLISAGVSFLLWWAVSRSLDGLAFTLPWAYVGAALLMTVVAMALSVAYGLRRCSADNVVEALRDE